MNKRKKIILVDDIQFHLLSTKERLKSRYDIFTAQSSDDLFNILDKVFPELILLDINMPGEDGFELLKKLKEDPRYSEIPVIFLTANVDKKNVVKGMNLGAVDFVNKPFVDSDLIDSIERFVNPDVQRKANKPVVLAVDDNPIELQTISFFLKSDYTVYTLPEPGRLKDLLGIISPDIFLLDCQMPVLSGFDLVPMIRKIQKYEDTPIIFVTSVGSIDNISVALHLGASDFIVKPIDEATLKEKVSLHLKDFIMQRRIRDNLSLL